ncbi:MAG: peptidase S8 [Desulfuromonadales bacterium]|nr:MAG: peptidase S8 [Desulfuromonadales bacterium]
MSIARLLLLLVAGTLLLPPHQSFAATRKVIIGFHRAPAADEHNLVYGAKGRIRRAHRHIPAISAELPEEEIARLKSDPSVAYVVDNIKFKPVQPAQTLSAPSPEYVDSWGVLRIGAETAAARGFTGAGVKVAIIDTGIDYNHPDLKDNYRGGYNFLPNNSDPYDPYDDVVGSHGTHVAGIIAARNNGTGVVGVAPDASLYAAKVFGNVDNPGGDMDTIVAAIEWAIENKMDVINFSIGLSGDIYSVYPDYFRPLKDVCAKAYQAGIVLVAAVGNDDREIVSVPAAFDSVVAVSATDINDQRAIFNPKTFSASSYGAKVEVAAPGMAIKSTVSGGGYDVKNGTSQAAPHVAGVAALILSSGIADANGDGSRADDVRARLAATAKDLGEAGRDKYFGWGLVDAAAATGAVAPVETHAVNLTITHDAPKSDVKKVQLTKGAYSVTIKNSGLRKVVAKTSDKGRHGREKVFSFLLNRECSGGASFELVLDDDDVMLDIIPHGKVGTSAEIIFTKVNR